MYAKTKPAVIALFVWPVITAALIGIAYLLATHYSGALSAKNTLLRWGLASVEPGGFLTFGAGAQVSISFSALVAWAAWSSIPTAGLYLMLAMRKTQNEVDVNAASHPHVQPPAQQQQQQDPAYMMGNYPGAQQMGPPGYQGGPQYMPANVAGAVPNNPGGG